jgi:FtsP/CotA-like multicopper oxidase with cupredoxin domain
MAIQVVDPQYSGLKGLWKDTLFIKNLAQQGWPSGEYTIVVRTRYERYIGDFVLHCHILDHEDQGMMQNIRIALPDGHGGVARAHH